MGASKVKEKKPNQNSNSDLTSYWHLLTDDAFTKICSYVDKLNLIEFAYADNRNEFFSMKDFNQINYLFYKGTYASNGEICPSI